MVLSGLKLGTPTLVARYGREATKRMYALSLSRSIAWRKSSAKKTSTAIFRAAGIWKSRAKQNILWTSGAARKTIEREFNHKLRIIEKADLPNEIGSPIITAGSWTS